VRFSFRHAYRRRQLLTYHAQVKSGSSYRASSSTRSTLTLGLDHATLLALSGSGAPGIVIWVPPEPLDRLYWYATDPRAGLKTPVRIDRDRYLRPSIRYDLTRLWTYAAWSRSFSGQTVANLEDRAVLARAKLAYASLKTQPWHSPLVGAVRITRLAWRHVSMRSKPARRRILSLRAVPYLKAFLSHAPDRFVHAQGPIIEVGRRTVETRYVLCWYRGALSISGRTYSLLVRIKEEISYPTMWSRYPLSVDDVRQEATLASWWCKADT